MYICMECGREFTAPVKLLERHGFSSPPFEKLYVCPYCKSTDYKKQRAEYCRCCGAKLRNSKNDYCSTECQIKGERLWAKERKRKKLLCDSELYQKVREIEHYNKIHGTNYSYGQYNIIASKTQKEE